MELSNSFSWWAMFEMTPLAVLPPANGPGIEVVEARETETMDVVVMTSNAMR